MLAALLAGAVLAGLAAVAAWAAKDDLTLVSRVSGANGAGADALSTRPGVSSNSRYVVFDSTATNLSGEDVDPVRDVFVRDLQTNVLTLVSRATGAGGAAGTTDSLDASISSDGRYVAFDSNADNLSLEDDNTYRNLFVRDLQAGTTTYVGRASGAAGTAANDSSFVPVISSDGRHVTFQSNADNLSAEDNNGFTNIFIRDLQTNTTTLVSRATGAAGTGADDSSALPVISADGRYVGFYSAADNLSTEDNNTYLNVFVRDLQANTTTLVSRATGPAGTGGNDSSYSAAISGNGRYVSFTSFADNLSTEDNNTYSNIFVRDLTANTTTLVSRAAGAAGAAADDSSDQSTISGDGRRVTFYSSANNMSAEDNNAYANIFVRDLTANTVTFASRAAGAAGAAGDDHSTQPRISPEGRHVAFVSEANDLSDDDNDAYANIFVRDLGPLPGGGGGGGGGADTTKPVVSRLGMTNRRFRVGKARTPISAATKVGTRFRYSLTERSAVRITIERALPGRRARKRSGPCRAPSKKRAKNRKCTRYKRAGSLIRANKGPGRASTSFTGRIGRKALKPGRYRATLLAADAAGNRSSLKRIAFTVVKR